MIVLYNMDHEALGLLANNITLKPASQYLHDTLTVSVMYDQAQGVFSVT